ncbi:DUF3995 domain-containing protein [Pseudotenacibaculum haliotis]|uniref:DUF3995 domain-containing protein n=1 Tax=Pseudotenacibaculum haliotis TaxID=1862138 RepID=A0ABW5LLV7_9FLAO
MILSIILSLIFLVLSLIHFNWALGGSYGFEVSLPTKVNGERILNPKKIDSAIVGLGLLSFSLFYFFNSQLVSYSLPDWITTYASWIIPIIFTVRAIGDFKYVGFFKSVKSTKFGKVDTRFFSPLCLSIGLTGILIAVA